MTPELILAVLALVAVVALAVVVIGHVVSGRRRDREIAALRADRQSLAARVEELRERVVATEEAAAPSHEVALILNPVKNDAEQVRGKVMDAVRHYGFGEALVLETAEDDAGTQMARDAIEAGVGLVIVAGGDGTVRLVAEELTGSGIPLGVVPMGTGNLLARNLDLPINDLEECIRIALHGRRRVIDTVDIRLTDADGGQRRDTFTVIAGAGYDADIMGDTRDDLKSRAGWLAYSEAGLRHLGGARHEVTVTLDGGTTKRFKVRSVMVANCGMLTGGLELLPEAKLDDGLLDVVVLSPKHALDWARIAAKTLVRSKRPIPVLETEQATRVSIRLAEPMPSQLDGDATGDVVAIDARVQPDTLTVMIGNEERASVE